MRLGGCFKELPEYKSVEELAKCKIPDLLAFLEEVKQHEQDMRDDYVQMFGEIKMEEITIEKFQNLEEANDDTAVEGGLYRNKGSVEPPAGSLKVGYVVQARQCVRVTPIHTQQPLYETPTVEYLLVELMLVEDEDTPAEEYPPEQLNADRRYWARNRVIMKCIKQALGTFLFEPNTHNNRVYMSRMCTLRLREDYPDCHVVCSCTGEQLMDGNKFDFVVTEGKLTTHYHAEVDKDKADAAALVNITGEENNG